MTAEIAILNTGAIHLAADSAVTIPGPRGQKVYNTVNKLFTLSKYRPIGIMVFGNAAIMGIPWETIIKVYRRQFGKKMFNTVKEYSEDFIRFLDDNNKLVHPTVQEDFYGIIVSGLMDEIRKEVDGNVRALIEKSGTGVTDAQVQQELGRTISEWRKTWEAKFKRLPHLPEDQTKNVLVAYRKKVDLARKERFKNHNLADAAVSDLDAIVEMVATHDVFSGIQSGVVVAGFGENEIFPPVEAYTTEGIYLGRLKYRREEKQSGSIDYKTGARIIPFAQVEEAITFITSVSPSFQNAIKGYVTKLFQEYPKQVAEIVPSATPQAKEELLKKLQQGGTQVVQDFIKRMDNHIQVNQVQPIISAVQSLPKEELAVMAEALVYLTSLRRRMSLDTETVGGPVDVAVISKGDGFVWIKRKHYFSKDLNPQFFANYYLEG
ncbi:MAG: hypothetical protein HYT80_10865 [Euryarchaeota archaeon]|nr:hypothetical protein [Euryarchaeota archaeon]